MGKDGPLRGDPSGGKRRHDPLHAKYDGAEFLKSGAGVIGMIRHVDSQDTQRVQQVAVLGVYIIGGSPGSLGVDHGYGQDDQCDGNDEQGGALPVDP